MSTAWMPPPGRHSVQIGQSLTRALKVRRGEPAHQKSSKIPDKEFYSFRYNFKPEGVDSTKVGSIEIRRDTEVTSVMVEKGSERPDEAYLFTGKEEAVKDWDCLLVYDEETGRYTLEKLDTYLRLAFDRKASGHGTLPRVRLVYSPICSLTSLFSCCIHRSRYTYALHTAATPRASPSKLPVPERKPQDDADFDLENELLAGLDDADGKASMAAVASKPVKGKAPQKPVPRKEEEEESDGEILEAVEAASKPKQKARPEPAALPPANLKTKPSPIQRLANAMLARSAAAGAEPPPVPKARVAPASQTKAKKDASAGKKRALDEETFDFALPSQPAKRPRPSSPPSTALPKQKEKDKEKPSFSLALPTSTPASKQAEPPTPLSFPGSAAPVTLPGAGSSAAVSAPQASFDSDEEEWDEVQPSASASAPPSAPMRVIEMEEIVPTSSPRRPSPPLALSVFDGDGEIDEDDFEMEEVEVAPFVAGDVEEEDFLAAAVSPVQEMVALPDVE
ncbi:RNA polymerase II transcription elongation factor-domain-containing protein [Fomitopsis serialis]|uniref:RNA polymerase II transcription elongation factor-domain-containing protein n=1 Tax=Fomitopsis serialis TaxID=139415 RepID=UPI002007F0B2|nr:RNA polymerase II transcription elongation factor-domain-containing protein [Neoantrodia serialis]KAH9938669.1 RNA polymerase II transcription elongation factor-domain-containing protein [Neoantrodia serialis]